MPRAEKPSNEVIQLLINNNNKKQSSGPHENYNIVKEVDDPKYHVKGMDSSLLKLETIEQFR